MKKQSLLNTYVNNVSMSEAIYAIEAMIQQKKKSYVVPINVDVVIKIEKDATLKRVVDSADMVLVDGKPLIWISKLHKKPVKSKISGSDLVPELCKTMEKKGYSIFLLGGKEGVAKKAEMVLKTKYPKLKVVGTYAPPNHFENDEKQNLIILDMINKAKPDVLIACFGCPKQEKWVWNNYKEYDAIVSICAGATVDFLSGNKRRAPKWMSDVGLEWFYRFIQEPKRMFKRYFIDDIQILKLIYKYRRW